MAKLIVEEKYSFDDHSLLLKSHGYKYEGSDNEIEDYTHSSGHRIIAYRRYMSDDSVGYWEHHDKHGHKTTGNGYSDLEKHLKSI